MSNRDNLAAWRSERNIQKQEIDYKSYRVFAANILEELLEPLFDKELVTQMVIEIIKIYFPKDGAILDNREVIDAITDIRVFAENQTEIYGYNSTKTLAEVIKEISSREQDPVQYKNWQENGNNGEKWQKNINQNLATLYKADFNNCKN